MPTCRFLSGEASPKPRAFPFALFFSPFHCGCDVGRVTWWVPTASKSLSHQPSRIWTELNLARVGGEDWLKLICFSRTHTCPWFPDLTAVYITPEIAIWRCQSGCWNWKPYSYNVSCCKKFDGWAEKSLYQNLSMFACLWPNIFALFITLFFFIYNYIATWTFFF